MTVKREDPDFDLIRSSIGSAIKSAELNRLGWRANNLLDLYQETYQENKQLRKERDEVIEANNSVAVCSDHTREIVFFDGCVICEINRLRDIVRDLDRACPPGRVTLFRHKEPETGMDCKKGFTIEFEHGTLTYEPEKGE